MSSLDAGHQRPGNGSTGPPPLQPITITLNASATGSESAAGGGDGEKGKSFWALLVLAETHAVYPLLIAAGLLCNSLAIVTLRQRNLRTNLTYFSLVFVLSADLGVLAVGLTNQFTRNTFNVDVRGVSNVSCKLHVAATHVCMDFSIWALCFISIQRLLVIYRPFLFERLFTRRSVSVLLSLLFLLVLLKNIVFASFFELRSLPSGSGPNGSVLMKNTCAVHKKSDDLWRHFDVVMGWIEMTVKFLVPFPVQLLSSVLLFATLRRQLADAQSKLRISRGVAGATVQRHPSAAYVSTAAAAAGRDGATHASVVELTATPLRKSSEEQWQTRTGRKESAPNTNLYSSRRSQRAMLTDVNGRRQSATPAEKLNGGSSQHVPQAGLNSKRNSAAILSGTTSAAAACNGGGGGMPSSSPCGSSALVSKIGGSSTSINKQAAAVAAGGGASGAGCNSGYHNQLAEGHTTSVGWSTSAILLAINLSFLLCHGPINCFNIFLTTSGVLEKLSHGGIAEVIVALSQTLITVQYMNHALNFVLYLLVGRHFRRNLRDVLTRISSKWKGHGPAAYSAAVSMQMMERRVSRQPRLDESVAAAAAVATSERNRRERSPSPRVRMLALAEEQKQQEANQHQQHQHRFVPNSHGGQRPGRGVHFPCGFPLGPQQKPASLPELDDGTPVTNVETLFSPLTPDPSSYAPDAHTKHQEAAAAAGDGPVDGEPTLASTDPVAYANPLHHSNGHL